MRHPILPALSLTHERLPYRGKRSLVHSVEHAIGTPARSTGFGQGQAASQSLGATAQSEPAEQRALSIELDQLVAAPVTPNVQDARRQSLADHERRTGNGRRHAKDGAQHAGVDVALSAHGRDGHFDGGQSGHCTRVRTLKKNTFAGRTSWRHFRKLTTLKRFQHCHARSQHKHSRRRRRHLCDARGHVGQTEFPCPTESGDP